MFLDKPRDPVQSRIETGGFTGLHEAEMALRQRQRRIAGQGAEYGNAARGNGVGDEHAVAFAGDAVQDHAGDLHRRVVGGKAALARELRARGLGLGSSFVALPLEDAARRAVDFAVVRTGRGRKEAYMLLSIIGELRVGTSPRPVMATRLIVPEEQLRAAGWNGELP